MSVRAGQLTALADALGAVLPLSSPADVALHEYFRRHHRLGQRDRALVADGVFATLRRRRSLIAQAESDAPRLLAIAACLRELGLSLRELEPALTQEEQRWARAFKARKPQLSPAEAVDLPDWLWDALGRALPDERDALARAWLAPAPLDLRVNALKTSREEARAALAANGIEASPTPYSPVGLRVAGKPALQHEPLFLSGAIEVQDEASQIACYLVAPKRGEMVVDFCAGAGGKTLALGALMRSQGRLYAFDVSARRLAKLKPRLARSGLSNAHPVLIQDERAPHVKRLAGKIDRVLVDAPCSGFGTLRRNPDLKWRQTPAAISELSAKQSRLLAAAATLVKPGGRLVYATCSVLPAENEAIVDDFLASHPEFTLGDAAAELARAGIALETGKLLRLSAHRHGCDGFFAAILERRAGTSMQPAAGQHESNR
ncbi:MAG TPA: RsmB/NOP family class I SAM-dependent RNA methyltransferase [Casimicrobiaceae bacterium]|nr:RsmB/NOP family class I SAM-dependent RNA methyltransferase [Casimicrobiaceae bacterium]